MSKLTALMVGVFLSTAVMADSFQLSSTDISPGSALKNEQVFSGFGCEGENKSPTLNWINPPEGTKSYAITIYDPDAPTGSGWWHWVMINIPATTTTLPKNAGDASENLAPEGSLQTRTDFGTYGYGGACPPVGHGIHHYHIKLHALDTDKLDLEKDTSAAMVGFYLNGHTIGTAELSAVYER